MKSKMLNRKVAIILAASLTTTSEDFLTYRLPAADQVEADMQIDNKKYTVSLKKDNESVVDVVVAGS